MQLFLIINVRSDFFKVFFRISRELVYLEIVFLRADFIIWISMERGMKKLRRKNRTRCVEID